MGEGNSRVRRRRLLKTVTGAVNNSRVAVVKVAEFFSDINHSSQKLVVKSRNIPISQFSNRMRYAVNVHFVIQKSSVL